MKRRVFPAILLALVLTLMLSAAAQAGWKTNASGKYFVTSSGKILKSSWLVSGGKKYFCSKTGRIYTNCRVKINGSFYGFGSDGAMLRGKHRIGSNTYYFAKKTGKMIAKAFVTISGKKYYFGKTGAMRTKVWVSRRYVGPDGYVLTNRWIGARYVGSDGKSLSGLQQLDGTWYYFDPSTRKKVTGVTKTIDGTKYKFDENGKGKVVNGSKAPTTTASVQSTYYSDPYVNDETLLAAIIYCEAGNQPYYGQLGVGIVITNRMRSASFPSKLREVVYQTSQFSPTFDGALTSVLKDQSRITASAKKAAKEVMSMYNKGTYTVTVDGKKINLQGYVFFMTQGAYQRLGMKSAYDKIGDHVFFKTWQR